MDLPQDDGCQDVYRQIDRFAHDDYTCNLINPSFSYSTQPDLNFGSIVVKPLSRTMQSGN
jgi:hypothetical protein